MSGPVTSRFPRKPVEPLYLILYFEASDNGYSAASSILSKSAAETFCEVWCLNHKIPCKGLDSYEKTDDNGFFFGFEASLAIKGAIISTGQYR